MKTTRFLLLGFVLVSLACCALAAPESAETLFATNVVLSLRPLAFPPRDEQSLFSPDSGSFLTDGQLPLRAQRSAEILQGPESGVEWAERLNAEAMRRYREKWEKRLSAPPALPAPALYRSKVEENLE